MSDHPDYCAGHNDGYEQAVEELKGEGVVAIPRAQYDALMVAVKVMMKLRGSNAAQWRMNAAQWRMQDEAVAALRAVGIQTEEP